MNAQVTPTQKSKNAIAALMASEVMTHEKVENLLGLLFKLQHKAMCAHDKGLIVFHEVKTNDYFSEVFYEAMKNNLGEVRQLLVEIGSLVNGK